MSSHSTIGFGASYYFEKEAPSLYLDGGFGGSIIYNPLEDRTMGGRGFYIGAGYEFQRHWSIKCDIMRGQSVTEKSSENYGNTYDIEEPKAEALSLLLTMNMVFY